MNGEIGLSNGNAGVDWRWGEWVCWGRELFIVMVITYQLWKYRLKINNIKNLIKVINKRKIFFLWLIFTIVLESGGESLYLKSLIRVIS